MTRRVEIGSIVGFEGCFWKVVGLSGLAVRLRTEATPDQPSNHKSELEHVDTLFSSETFFVHEAGTPVPELPAPSGDVGVGASEDELVLSLDDVALGVRNRAVERAGMVRTMLYGYASGAPAFEGEDPDPEYAKCLDQTQKYEVLSARADRSTRTVMRWTAAYKRHGTAGLVDDRSAKFTDPLGNLDPVVRKAMESVLTDLVHASRVSNNEIRRRVVYVVDGHNRQVEQVLVQDPTAINDPARAPDLRLVKVPPLRTFNLYLSAFASRSGRHLSTKSMRNRANAPQGPFMRVNVTRPFEYVLLDSTPLDMFAYDPVTSQWAKVTLTIALDLYTRSLVGWVFTPGDPSSADISTLMFRVMTPKVMQPGWPEYARWRYPSLPENIVVEVAHPPYGIDPHDGLAGVPFAPPEQVVIDHGKVFTSTALREGLAAVGTSLQLARVLTPTDKSHVEAVFRRIRLQFTEKFPGYKGEDLTARGVKSRVEDEAVLLLGEIEGWFADWVATSYQVTPHRGLFLPDAPKLEVSPNTMFDEGVTRAGFRTLPPTRNLAIELLPTEWRTIQRKGVEIDGLPYDDDDGVLADHFSLQSPYTQHPGKWKFKRDARDLRHVYFWAPSDSDQRRGTWVTLRCTVLRPGIRAFNDKELAYAKAIVRGGGSERPPAQEIVDALDRYLLRLDQGLRASHEERRMFGRSLVQQANVVAGGPKEAVKRARNDKGGSADLRTPASAMPAGATANSRTRDDAHIANVLDDAEAARRRDELDEIELLATPEEHVIDVFGDLDDGGGDADDNDLGGHENLETER